METTAFDAKSSLNPKGGLPLLMRDPAKLPAQAVQPGKDCLFAGMLGEKISQAKLSGSASDPAATAASRGKRPFNGIAGDTPSEMAADSSVSDMENPSFDAALMLVQSQTVMPSLREDAPLSVAGPAKKKSVSPTDKAESTGGAKTAIHPAKKRMMEQALTIPATDGDPAGKPAAAATADPATPVSHEVRPPSDRYADHRIRPKGAELRTEPASARQAMEPAFTKRADETPKPENARPATDGDPAGKPAAAATADPATPVSQGIRPPSDRYAGHRSLPKGAELRTEPAFDRRMTEPAFTQRADETPKPENARPATDGDPAGKPAAAATADPATPVSQGIRPPSDRYADHRSLPKGAELRTEPASARQAMEPAFTQRADETLKPENVRPATDGDPAGKPAAAATADPATPVSQGIRPPSDRYADHRILPKGAELRTEPLFTRRMTEPAFTEKADETPKPENARPATDSDPAGKPAAAATADPATPVSQGVRPPSDRYADHRILPKGAELRTEPASAQRVTEPLFTQRVMEPAFTKRADETLKPKNARPATDGDLPDVRQAGPSRQDHGKRAGESKEGAGSFAATREPISAASEGNAKIAQAAPEGETPGGSPDKTLPVEKVVTETPGPARDHQQSRNTMPNRQSGLPERDMILFRMEMPNVVSPQETRPVAAVGSAGIDMQAVIDQIREARQGASNDFGRMRILLNPPNLGTVDLDIVVRGERVEVVMTAENATVQQALQSRGDDIRIALQRQDLKIEGFQVLLQDNGTNPQQTGSGAMHRQNREHGERFNADGNVPPVFPVFSSIAGAKSAEGLVSIFA